GGALEVAVPWNAAGRPVRAAQHADGGWVYRSSKRLRKRSSMRRSSDRCCLRGFALGPAELPPTTRRSGLPNSRFDCEMAYTTEKNMIRNPTTANGTEVITPVSSAPTPSRNPTTDHTMRRRACVRRFVELTVEANFGSSAY